MKCLGLRFLIQFLLLSYLSHAADLVQVGPNHWDAVANLLEVLVEDSGVGLTHGQNIPEESTGDGLEVHVVFGVLLVLDVVVQKGCVTYLNFNLILLTQ